MIRKKWWCLILVIPLLPWLIRSANFFYPRYSEFSDLTITHLPNAIYLVNSIKNFGILPLWSDLIFGGYPFAASPLSGLWYPPGWLAYILPQPFGFNLVVIIHLFWGAIGFKRFLDYLGLRSQASLLGVFGFLLMPKLFAHYAAGHITMVYAVCWTPWLLFNQAANQRISRPVVSAAILSLIALADVRWLAYALLLWGGFVIFEQKPLFKPIPLLIKIKHIAEIPIVLVGAILLAAVILLPLAEFTRHSTRIFMDLKDLVVYSLPVEELLGLWIPDFGGFAEWTLYPGAIIICLGIYCLSLPNLRKKTRFWWMVVIFSLLLAVGDALPFFSVLSRLPAMDLLRVPTRFYFMGGMAFPILAACGLNDLLQREQLFRPDPVFFMTPFVAFTGFFGLGFLVLGERLPANLIWGFVIFLVVIFLIAVLERNRRYVEIGGWMFVLLLVLDLTMVNFQSIRVIPAEKVFGENRQTVQFLKSQTGDFRVYSPSYSIPQHIAALNGIKMVNGIDPLILRAYQEFFVKASGIPSNSYSVTLPPFPTNDPETDNQKFTPDLELMSLLGVRFVVSEFDIISFQPYQVAQFSESRVYENPYFSGMAWVERENRKYPVDFMQIQPNKIEFKANGPGKLFLSHIDYPGWMVFIDDQPSTFGKIYNLFPVLDLPDGFHEIRLEFKPVLVYLGASISAIAWLGVILFLLLKRFNDKN